MDVSKRLYRVLRTLTEDRLSAVSNFIEQGDAILDEKLRAWEEKLGLNENGNFSTSGEHPHADQSTRPERESSHSSQFVEDLKLFNLRPPSSMQEVKQARNREMKVFHPDKYLNEPEKMEVANQIVKIYNDAYDRLKASFHD